MCNTFFVTGTDTGVGKTYATCALLWATRQQGLRTIGMKPIAAGVEPDGQNEDVRQLMAASTIQAPIALINPFLYHAPIAPHVAAQEARRPITLEPIQQALVSLQRCADVVWIEGAGGLCVPINGQQDTADLVLALNVPVIVVVGMRLGCLNHALLTAEVIHSRGLSFAGWIANTIDPHMARLAANIDTLKGRLNAPLLGVLPYGVPVEQAAQVLTCERLWR